MHNGFSSDFNGTEILLFEDDNSGYNRSVGALVISTKVIDQVGCAHVHMLQPFYSAAFQWADEE